MLSEPLKFYCPRRDYLLVIPYVVPIWSLSVLYLPPRKLFWSQILEVNRPFWVQKIFYIAGGGWWMVVVDGTRVAHLEVEKNNLFGNISKTAEYFYLIVFGPHRRVLKTYSGIFRFGKIGKFSTQKSPNVFVVSEKNVKKITLFWNISKTAQYFFPYCFWSPQKIFQDIFWNIPIWKNRNIFHSKIA